ncbi:MAG: hypothetical protein ABIE14_02340 [Patescibacteria group bacterium]
MNNISESHRLNLDSLDYRISLILVFTRELIYSARGFFSRNHAHPLIRKIMVQDKKKVIPHSNIQIWILSFARILNFPLALSPQAIRATIQS